jgi:hypothetical protein
MGKHGHREVDRGFGYLKFTSENGSWEWCLINVQQGMATAAMGANPIKKDLGITGL